MKALLASIDRMLQWVLVMLMSAMVLSVTWQVVSRYVLSSASSWTEEVARFLLIWIGMLGAAYAFRTRMHIGLDLLPNRLTGKAARNLRWLTQAVILLFALGVLVIGGAKLVWLTWDLRQNSAVLGLPMAVVYSVIPVTGILIMLFELDAN